MMFYFILVDAIIGDFGEFSDCSASCGEGIQSRFQECIINEVDCNPTETSGSCGSIQTQTQSCVGFQGCGLFLNYPIISK